MTTLGFTVTFHGPFRVGAAYGRDGIDAAIDHDDPLPADHLKGIMRDAAAMLLGDRSAVLGAVFGTTATPSPWAWSSATAKDGNWRFGRNYRVKIDAETHSAAKDQLVLGEQAWPDAAAFTVTSIRPQARDEDVLVLRCAAAAVHGLGAWRRRGLGWVGIAQDNGPVTAAEVERLMALRDGSRG